MARTRQRGSYVLLTKAQRKKVIRDLEAIEDRAGGVLALRIRAIRRVLWSGTFSGKDH